MRSNTQLKRIVSNYIRMAVTFLFGIWLLRLLLQFGDGVYAAVALTGSSIGIAEILKEMVRGATIPALGISYHQTDNTEFKHVYASTLVLSVVAALFAVLTLGLFLVFIDEFNIPVHLREATVFYISCRMAYTFFAICASPILNMLPITDRMISYNVWLIIERSGEILSALIVTYLLVVVSDADALTKFSGYSALFMVATVFASVVYVVCVDKAFWPTIKFATLGKIRKIAKNIGWNGAAVVSVNLYLRFDLLLINIFYGIQATIVFGLASQLAAYTRIMTMGLVSGLDAVVTQKKSSRKDVFNNAAVELSRNIVRLQSLILGFIFLILVSYSYELTELLLGDRISNPEIIPEIVLCFLILMIGMFARSLSEGWMSILAGSGKIKEYAVPVFLGSVLNPVIVIAISQFMGEKSGLLAIAVTFSVLNIIFHMGVVPVIVAREFDSTLVRVFQPLGIPLLLTVVGAVSIELVRQSEIASGTISLLLTLVVSLLFIVPYGVYSLLRLIRDV